MLNKNVFSYGKFILENPKRIKKERIKAIFKFINNTR